MFKYVLSMLNGTVGGTKSKKAVLSNRSKYTSARRITVIILVRLLVLLLVVYVLVVVVVVVVVVVGIFGCCRSSGGFKIT